MAKKRFPADAVHTPIPIGNEPIFATRALDGVVLYFTASELINSMVTAGFVRQILSVSPNLNSSFLPDVKLDDRYFYQPSSTIGGEVVLGDITPLFSFWDTYIDARIAAAGGGQPTPPTVTFDPVTRKIKSIHLTYPGQQEVKIGSASYVNYTDNQEISVGDSAVSANFYLFRVKASGSRPAGATAGNLAIPAASTPGITRPTTPVEAVNQVYDTNIFSVNYADLGGNASRSRFREYIPAGQDGYIEGVISGVQLILDDQPGEFSNNPVFGIFKNMGNDHIDVRFRNEEGNTNYDNLTTNSNPVIGRLDLVGSSCFFTYRQVGSDIPLGSYSALRPVGVDLYFKTNDGDPGYFLGDVKMSGASTNTNLT